MTSRSSRGRSQRVGGWGAEDRAVGYTVPESRNTFDHRASGLAGRCTLPP
jgi:hypothetical protein